MTGSKIFINRKINICIKKIRILIKDILKKKVTTYGEF